MVGPACPLPVQDPVPAALPLPNFSVLLSECLVGGAEGERMVPLPSDSDRRAWRAVLRERG